MSTIIKSTSEIFNAQKEELIKCLHGYRHFNSDIKKCLEKFGYKVLLSGNHYKCYYKNYLVTTIASTPSDLNAGKQTLRYIRSFWESYERN